jgi:hypothetical protein
MATAFARDALHRATERIGTCKLEEKHRQGHIRKPAGVGGFGSHEKDEYALLPG